MSKKIEAKVCKQCESVRPDEDNFCTVCGEKLDKGVVVLEPVKEEAAAATTAKQILIFNLDAGHKCSIDCISQGTTIEGPAIVTVEK